jgi:agmatinase
MIEDLRSILTFPGNGVFTVNTAKEKKEALLNSYYQASKTEEVSELWSKSLAELKTSPCVILGAPSDCGAGIVRGSNWGPLAIREALLKEDLCFLDIGDLRVVPHLLDDSYLNELTLKKVRKALYDNEYSSLPVSPLSQLEFVSSYYFKHCLGNLLVLGGDHSISYPLVKSWLNAQKRPTKVGVLHFDAHTDLLASRLGVDFCFGSWAYHAVKMMKNPAGMVQVGIRSSGKSKDYWEQTFGIKQVWGEEFSTKNIEVISDEILNHYLEQKIEKLYLSFDIDAISSEYVTATGTPESGGPSPYQCLEIIKKVSSHIPIVAADLVEVAPYIQYPESKFKTIEPHSTLDSAVSIIKFLIEYWNERNH